jgi:hypothetical protein
MPAGHRAIEGRRVAWARDLAVLLLTFLLALLAQGQTVVSGTVAADSRWTLALSPIVVQGN